ncbi:MAG: response regulator transcription factor [Anaerolineae bacterium]|nr:response regulator transcription factor [Anaerolineae bacterium]
MTIRVLVVDDHGVVRKGIRMYLGADPEFEIVAEASNGQEALTLARELRPDVILMDLLMPVMDGIAATAAIRRELPDVEVIALTSVLEDTAVAEAVRVGAIGYLLKDAESSELTKALRAAASGRVYLTQAALARLMRDVGATGDPAEALTPREVEVLRLIAQGRSNREISGELSVTDHTVKTHISHIYDKLGVRSRTQAALYAIDSGLADGR